MMRDSIILALNTVILDIDRNDLGSAKEKLHLLIQQLLQPPAPTPPPVDVPTPNDEGNK